LLKATPAKNKLCDHLTGCGWKIAKNRQFVRTATTVYVDESLVRSIAVERDYFAMLQMLLSYIHC
jgi:hypothetical protein